MSFLKNFAAVCFCGLAATATVQAQRVFIRDVPDYTWYSGCFGTASGNLMGFWDRNGFPDSYAGPTAGGVAPLNSNGGNAGIRSLWASKAGFDGRPANQPGHLDDYWEFFQDEQSYSYESSAPDPYQLAGRAEHAPDSIGDYIGASQNKWSNLDGECSGNIDAFAFNFWDKTGNRRENFTPPLQGGEPIPDIQSGWREWAKSRGFQADTFSQLVDFNPEITGPGTGFTFEDLQAEIDAGYPVMLFLQNPGEYSRPFPNMARGGNPNVHGMIAYGYWVTPTGGRAVRYRTSWGDGDNRFAIWGPNKFEAELALRGVVGFRPKPRIKEVQRIVAENSVRIKWEGPSALLQNETAGTVLPAHKYVVEKASSLASNNFQEIGEPTVEKEVTISNIFDPETFFRVKLVPNPQ